MKLEAMPVFRICVGLCATILFVAFVAAWVEYWYSLAHQNWGGCMKGPYVMGYRPDGTFICGKP
jgi:hypothetical protein